MKFLDVEHRDHRKLGSPDRKDNDKHHNKGNIHVGKDEFQRIQVLQCTQDKKLILITYPISGDYVSCTGGSSLASSTASICCTVH